MEDTKGSKKLLLKLFVFAIELDFLTSSIVIAFYSFIVGSLFQFLYMMKVSATNLQ